MNMFIQHLYVKTSEIINSNVEESNTMTRRYTDSQTKRISHELPPCGFVFIGKVKFIQPDEVIGKTLSMDIEVTRLAFDETEYDETVMVCRAKKEFKIDWLDWKCCLNVTFIHDKVKGLWDIKTAEIRVWRSEEKRLDISNTLCVGKLDGAMPFSFYSYQGLIPVHRLGT